MSEPRKVRGKSMNQLSEQLGRVVDELQRRYNRATTESERDVVRRRYDRVADAYQRYNNNMGRSQRMARAINDYRDRTGGLAGISDVAGDVVIPRSQYMRRNRR